MNEIIHKLAEYEKLFVSADLTDDKEAYGNLFSDKFIEIGSSGKVYDKKQTIEGLKSGKNPQTVLSEFSLLYLEGNTYLLTYKAQRVLNGRTIMSKRSSIWQCNEDIWQILFHQGTNIPE